MNLVDPVLTVFIFATGILLPRVGIVIAVLWATGHTTLNDYQIIALSAGIGVGEFREWMALARTEETVYKILARVEGLEEFKRSIEKTVLQILARRGGSDA